MSDLPSFFDWLGARPELKARPWLMLGKGPSYAKLGDYDVGAYATLSLNHVVRERPVTVAHIIDIDVVDDCGEALLTNAEVVVLPWQPHRDNRAREETLATLAEQNPILRRLQQAGRLAWYNLGSGKAPRPGSPIVPALYFSAEAGLGLLGQAGVEVVRSLGVDGGASYSATFQDLADKTLLSNGRTSFDAQFAEFPKIIGRTGVDYAPLDLESPIRVYVATSDSEMLPVKVLEYSIHKHCSMSVRVQPLHQVGIEIPMPREVANRPRTPFSFQRFLIPEAAGRTGKGIYLDADMQLFQDIRRMWATPMDGAEILAVSEPSSSGRKPQFSVMLLDCERLPWSIGEIVDKLDSGALTYEQLMYEMAAGGRVARILDPAWNSLERYKPGETALLHYTDMQTQPWVSTANPHGYLWVRDLLEAIAAGAISRDFVADHVARGWVRPSLLLQIDEDVADPLLLGRRAAALDRDFVAPYRSLVAKHAVPWTSPIARARALAREVIQRNALPALRRMRARLSL
jgi:hypothetical protein